MTTRERVLRFLRETDERVVHTRRVAGELELRAQDAGRCLNALERDGHVTFDYSQRTAGWRLREPHDDKGATT
jgi:predicted ArsR family transcriptional regulator